METRMYQEGRRPQDCLRLALLTCLVVAGCSTAAPPKTPEAEPSPLTKTETTPNKCPAPASSERLSESSLDSLRQGKVAETPAASPLKDIFIDFDRSDLRTDARETLKTNAEWLKANPAVRVEVDGHCDERGTTEYNLALGGKRAQAALDYLTAMGIAPQRLSTISYGSEVSVCQQHNEDCWQKNRHDRFVMKTALTN